MKSCRSSTQTTAGTQEWVRAASPQQSSPYTNHASEPEGEFEMHTYTSNRIAGLLLGMMLVAAAPLSMAQPKFGNPSPTAGSETSQKANASADQALYQDVVYANAGKKGPAVIVIPGEIKSNNATFLQRFTA